MRALVLESRPDSVVTSGLPGFDAIVGGLRIGDNVVWRVDDVNDYRAFLAPYAKAAHSNGRRVVYVRFASHAPLLATAEADAIYDLDAYRGFEAFTVHLHSIIAREGSGVFYVFDCLSDLLDAWATDTMVGNFFRVTCPYLFELQTVAYFALRRDAHSFATIDRIRSTTQVLLDLYNKDGELYLHPLKVWRRSSPTMFLPHRHAEGKFTPITVSCEATSLFAGFRRREGDAERHLDSWEHFFLRAADLKASGAPTAEQQAMVEQLCRLLIGRDERILALSHRYFSLDDLLQIKERMIGTGFIGGKAVGMLLARAVLRSQADQNWSEILEPHDSFFLGSDIYHSFIVANGWWRLFNWQRSEEGYLDGARELRELFAQGSFAPELQLEFQKMLEYFGQCPIIVRSSSLLEDGFGNAFAGKYESVFCVNQGTPEDRLAQFIAAVRTVYASTFSEEALHYRLQRGLARQEEQMALLVQRVSGAYHGRYFFPAFAGVGISYNTFVWRHDIDPHAGMLRIVVGLGTRAVDRVDGDYPRVAALDEPLLVPYANEESRSRFTQHDIDLLDVTENRWVSLPLNNIQAEEPTLPLELFGDQRDNRWLITFDRLLTKTDFSETMRRMLSTLERAYDYPVDVEFAGTYASDSRLYLNLIQCRPLQTRGIQAKRVEITVGNDDEVLFRSRGRFMGGSILQPIGRVVFIEPERYINLSLSDQYQVARCIGRINRIVKTDRRTTLLMGPGRWGTSTPSLGVPVRFAEIDAMTAIVELAFADGGPQPELSFGTHFFQDLVETGIFYVGLDRSFATRQFSTAILNALPNRLSELLGDDARLEPVIRLIDLPGGWRLMADIVSQDVVCARFGDTS